MNRRRVRQHLAVYLVMGLQEADGFRTEEIAREALEGGITMLQWREKDAPLRKSIEAGRLVRELCRVYHVPFIVNDRIDIAMLLDADGVHVGQDDMPCSMARRLLGNDKIIGVSAGTMDEAAWAAADGPDYLGVGPVYGTATKADAGDAIGTQLITDIRDKFGIPIVGIGGINDANAQTVIEAGAEGIAVVSAITRHSEPHFAARVLRELVESTIERRL